MGDESKTERVEGKKGRGDIISVTLSDMKIYNIS